MFQYWAQNTAEQILNRIKSSNGICLVLGGSDTGKTSLVGAIIRKVSQNNKVGIIDADVGQSHIGPPTTVGWAIIENPNFDFSNIEANGISFVGDITPVSHLLQMTAAIVQCFQQVSRQAGFIIIDTPGFISTSAASALWWTVERILQPQLIVAVQRKDELLEILAGLKSDDKKIEKISCPVEIPTKSLQQRQQYRQQHFNKYFRDSKLLNINFKDIAIQKGQDFNREKVGRLVALRDENGNDIAIGQIKEWNVDKGLTVIKAPQIDIQRIRCLVIGDVSIEITNER